jgi:hypothetical protein
VQLSETTGKRNIYPVDIVCLLMKLIIAGFKMYILKNEKTCCHSNG